MAVPTGTPLQPNIGGNEPTLYSLNADEKAGMIRYIQKEIKANERNLATMERAKGRDNTVQPFILAQAHRELADLYTKLDYAMRGLRFDFNAARRNAERGGMQ